MHDPWDARRSIWRVPKACKAGVLTSKVVRSTAQRVSRIILRTSPVRGSKKFSCENRGKANKRRPMTLVRVEETEAGGFTVLNLQLVARLKCTGFDGRQQEHRASVFFSAGGMEEFAATDVDKAMNAMEDLTEYHRS